MGLFGKSNKDSISEDTETRQMEKLIATETKNDQKNLDHAMRDLTKADKTHNNSIKAADKAQHALDEAVKKEHKTAKALQKAEYQHDNAISDQRNASKTLEIKHQHESRLEQDLQKRRASVEELEQRKAANDSMRESKLAQIHEQAAARAHTRAGSFEASTGPATGAAGAGPAATQGTSVGGTDQA